MVVLAWRTTLAFCQLLLSTESLCGIWWENPERKEVTMASSWEGSEWGWNRNSAPKQTSPHGDANMLNVGSHESTNWSLNWSILTVGQITEVHVSVWVRCSYRCVGITYDQQFWFGPRWLPGWVWFCLSPSSVNNMMTWRRSAVLMKVSKRAIKDLNLVLSVCGSLRFEELCIQSVFWPRSAQMSHLIFVLQVWLKDLELDHYGVCTLSLRCLGFSSKTEVWGLSAARTVTMWSECVLYLAAAADKTSWRLLW